MRSLVKRFRQQGGVVTQTQDGHLKLYKPIDRPGREPGYMLLGKLAVTGGSSKEADKRGLIAVRASMRRNGFDV